MRTNTVKRKIAVGQRVCGILLEFNNPELVELFGHLGYDFVFLDGQHCGVSPETARGLIRAADVTGMTSFVRVPRNDASIILEYLDAGAGGIVVPNIATAEEVRTAVSAMKYPPLGVRGGFARSRAASFGITQTQVEYFTRANDEVLFMPLVEDQSALPHLSEICATPGVDIVLVGPGDLSLSMGIPGGWKDPRVQAAVEQVRAAAAAAGKPAATLALDPADARALYDQGFQVLQLSVANLVASAARGFLQQIDHPAVR